MGCTTCGKTTSCGCTSGIPYYVTAETCPEDNCLKVYEGKFSFAVCPQSSWNVPLCGHTAMLSIEGLQGASVGSYMWHTTFGYFEITSIDEARGFLGITNNCTEGNAAPGTQIPACTCFVVTVPPSEIPSESGDCLTVDFTAPDEDVPLDITLSSTDGITASDTIQIGSGFYFVQEVKPNNIITIVNKGQGITPGTPVIAYDANGNFNYCISIVSSNACDREPISQGTLLACDEDGVASPLGTPCQAGYIPVAVADCEVEMQPAISAPYCAHTTIILDVVNTDPTYTITIDDSSGFVLGDMLTISGTGDTRATITAINSGTEIEVTFDPTPSTSYSLPIGTLLCTIDCCEDLNNRIALQAISSVDSAGVTPGLMNVAPDTADGNIANFGPYTNPSLDPLRYVATLEFVWAGTYDSPDALNNYQEAVITFIPMYNSVTGAIGTTVAPVPAVDATTPLGDSFINTLGDDVNWFSWNYGESHSYQISGTIAPGDELRVSAQTRLGLLQYDADTTGSSDPATVGVVYSVLRARITGVTITSI